MTKVYCCISTYKRYDTTLPLAIMSIIQQTKLPNKLVIYDDNEHPRDVRGEQTYQYLFQMLELKGVEWEWLFAQKKGQHHNHQHANRTAAEKGYDWVWRMDDDTVAEPDVLGRLIAYGNEYNAGAVGGAILTPPFIEPVKATGKIENITSEPNIQWGAITEVKEVEHLHCSFIYRPGIADYNLSLSRVAHREETLFTYAFHQKGYKILVVPVTTWHLKNNRGGIRADNMKAQMFEHDEAIFRNVVSVKDKTVVVLDCGMGDHIVFSRVLPDVKDPLVFSCYPEIVPGRSIAEAKMMFGDLGQWNVYAKMDQWNWKDSLESAFRKMYVEKAK